MLRRCMASVLGQSFPDWLHVIVNDGGNPYVVDLLVAEHAARYQGRVHVIHNPVSVGMQNASNLGIGEAAGDFLVIHDDDDSWQPEFLRACVGFLDQHGAASPVQGVITHTIRVLEEISPEGAIEEIAREDYMPCQSIDLFAAGADNPYAPIAFVYRRAVHERIGLFDERFSVVGDWDFNLRFLQLFEVGVISQRLANYHWRHRSGGSAYANTVTDALDVHVEKSTELRNHYLRMDLQHGQPGLGYLLNLARNLRGNSALLWEMRQRGDQTAHEISKVHTRLRRWEWFFTRNANLRSALQLDSPAGRPTPARAATVRPVHRRATAPRGSADELAALLARRNGGSCRVLSLDVFDTALLRLVRRPVDVFLFLEAPARRQLGLDTLPVAHVRISAERIARARRLALAGHEEVTLAEIYEAFCELAGVDPDIHRTALMQLELEAEQRLLYGNPPVLAAARSAARSGIRVVYASDMYLPRTFILDRLRQHGYPADDPAALFLSVDCEASKHVGNLYDQMLGELGCEPGEVVQVGDNLHSDVQQARSRGLRAVHWRPSNRPENLPLVEQGADGDGRSNSVTRRPARARWQAAAAPARPPPAIATSFTRAGSFQPPDAEPRGHMRGDLRATDPRPPQQRAPLVGAKRAGDRGRAVGPHDRVPERRAAQHAKPQIGKAPPVQVGDEPSLHAVGLRPGQEAHHIRVGEVVGELRADDEVGPGFGAVGEHVAGAVGDRAAEARGQRGAARVEVDAFEPDRTAEAREPGGDRAQQVAAAAGDVEHADRAAGRHADRRALEPGQRGRMRAGDAVDPLEVAQRRLVVGLGQVGVVHPLGDIRTTGQVDHGRSRNRNVSATMPGPNAIARPGPSSRLSSMRRSTNITVADDMLP